MNREQIASVLRKDLTDAQDRAVTSSKRHVLVVAGAGSGKTEVMARRIAWWVGIEGVPKDAIVAFTFTERAAEEMKFRIRSWLEAITPAGEEVSLGGMYVGTIHGYCLAKIREYWPDDYHNYDILDEGARAALILRGFRAANKTLSSRGSAEPFDAPWDKARTSRSARRYGRRSSRCCRRSSLRRRAAGLDLTTNWHSTASCSCCALAFLGKIYPRNWASAAA